jgi:hypothetical protein
MKKISLIVLFVFILTSCNGIDEENKVLKTDISVELNKSKNILEENKNEE